MAYQTARVSQTLEKRPDTNTVGWPVCVRVSDQKEKAGIGASLSPVPAFLWKDSLCYRLRFGPPRLPAGVLEISRHEPRQILCRVHDGVDLSKGNLSTAIFHEGSGEKLLQLFRCGDTFSENTQTLGTIRGTLDAIDQL